MMFEQENFECILLITSPVKIDRKVVIDKFCALTSSQDAVTTFGIPLVLGLKQEVLIQEVFHLQMFSELQI